MYFVGNFSIFYGVPVAWEAFVNVILRATPSIAGPSSDWQDWQDWQDPRGRSAFLGICLGHRSCIWNILEGIPLEGARS